MLHPYAHRNITNSPPYTISVAISYFSYSRGLCDHEAYLGRGDRQQSEVVAFDVFRVGFTMHCGPSWDLPGPLLAFTPIYLTQPSLNPIPRGCF